MARFCVLIPAHDEAEVIATTLASVAALNYPSDLTHCVVIADNCADNTANLVRRTLPTATVLERTNLQERGKGYALNWALAHILPERTFDAVVIVDADTKIDGEFLSAMNRAYQACPPAERNFFVAQGLYYVYNADENWRTALMAGALSLVHYVRPMARESWQVSVGLKGNGMCFAVPVCERIAWRGGSITEDIDYALDLIEQDHVRARFVPAALVRAQMPTTEAASEGQRQRWEGGRSHILRTRALPMLLQGILRADKLRIDAACDLICPPLAQCAALLVVWALVCIVAACVHAPGWPICAALCAASFAGFLLYVLGGFRVADAPAGAYKALGMAAVYVPWKIATLLRRRAKTGSESAWNRTERHSMELPTITRATAIDDNSLPLKAANDHR